MPGRTIIGCDNVIGHHAVVGIKCQYMKYKAGNDCFLQVGDNNEIREHVSIHRSSKPCDRTVIGDNNLIMGSCHITHDCKVGSNNIFANNTLLAGHVLVEDHAHTAGAIVVHQFCHVGSFCFIGGGSVVSQDVLKYTMVAGDRAELRGFNLEGLRRGGFSINESTDDPSPVLYTHRLDTNGYPQLFVRQGPVLIGRFGPWNGLKFQGMPLGNENSIYSAEVVVNKNEVYFKYETKGSVYQRILFMSDSNTVHFRWNDQVQDWDVYANIAVDNCVHYGFCGPYGSCSINRYPPCMCMEGFRPRLRDEWNSGNWSSGCQRNKAIECGIGDGFRKFSGVKLPDTQLSWYNRSMTLAECEMACRRDCSCTAYANLDIRNGESGCWLWFDELMDIREYDEKPDLYIRMAASELAGNEVSTHSFKNKGLLAVVLPTSSAVLILCVATYACIKIKRKKNKKKRPYMKGRGNWNALDKKKSDVHMEDLDDLPFF